METPMRGRNFVLFFAFVGMAAGIVICGCSKSSSTSDSPVNADAAVNADDSKQKSINNLKEIGMAMLNYASANNGDHFPSPGLKPGMKTNDSWASLPYSWRFSLAPYLERVDLYHQANVKEKGPLPDAVRNAIVPTYLNPLLKEKTIKTNYRAFVGNGAAFEWGRSMSIPGDFPDGMQNTILVVESAEPVDWTSLEDFEYDPKKPLPKLGLFPGGFHAASANGIVYWIPADTDEKFIHAMITRNGREKIKMPGKIVSNFYVEP
jgi:Protein of unknown function (DUF1559)